MTEQLSEPIRDVGTASAAAVSRPRLERLELRCTGCGYGAVTAAPPSRCPMCGGLDWDFGDWRPFSSGRIADG
jgi:rubrerythrin